LKNSATNKTTTVQDYSGDKTWSWNTNGYQEGDYTIYLWVRNAGSNNNWDAYAQFAFKLQDNSVLQSPQPLEAVVTPDMTSPQIKGQKVTFTGSASGGSGTYEYLFRLQDVTKKWATTVQQYSSDTTWTWNTGTYDTGDYKISLWVRNAGSQAEWEAWDQIAFKLQDNSVPQQPQPLEAVVTPDVASPQVKGQKVTFTGSATGGSGTYEYLFRLRDVNKKWAVTLQPYSSDTTWTWNTGTYDTGDYKISVWVRNAGSQAEWEAWDQIPYKLK
jgi:hypothetical protein